MSDNKYLDIDGLSHFKDKLTSEYKELLTGCITYKKLTGESFEIEDTLPAPFKNIRLFGKASQGTTTGKQLFNKATVVAGKLNENGKIEEDDTYSTSEYIPVTPETEYTCSTRYGLYRSCFYDSGKTFLAFSDEQSYTTPENAAYTRITLRNNSLSNAMLVKGTTTGSYESYTGGMPAPNNEYEAPISYKTDEIDVLIYTDNGGTGNDASFSFDPPDGFLAGIQLDSSSSSKCNYIDSSGVPYCCDEIDFKKGILERNCGVIEYDGSSDEAWSALSNEEHVFYIKANVSALTSAKNLCNRAFYCESLYTLEAGGFTLFSNNLYFHCADASTLSDFKSWLQTHPIKVVYASSSESQKTLPSEVIEQYNNTTAFSGNTKISAGYSYLGIEVEYPVSTQSYIDDKFSELSAQLEIENA